MNNNLHTLKVVFSDREGVGAGSHKLFDNKAAAGIPYIPYI